VKACAAPGVQLGEITYQIDRQLRQVSAYTAEGNLRHQWISRDDNGYHVPPTDDRAWDPVDIVGYNDCIYFLDLRYQAVYVHARGRESLATLFRSPDEGSRWTRLALDDSGCLLIFDNREEVKGAFVFDRSGKLLGTRKTPWPPPELPRCSWLKYKIDRKLREVTVHDLTEATEQQPDGEILYTWRSRDQHGCSLVYADQKHNWDPIDITGDRSCTFLLDQRYQIVYSHQFGRATLTPFCRSTKKGSHWSRLALDGSGYLMIFDSDETQALLYDREGEFRGSVDAGWPSAPPGTVDLKTDSPKEISGNDAFYPLKGSWLSEPLDSGVYNCQWHRLRMAVKQLPPGTQVEVKTFSYRQKDEAPVRPDDSRMQTAQLLIAPTQPGPVERTKKRIEECLVQSGPGQYLSVAIHLRGDGFGSPVLEGLRVQYPRESYLEYLPPLYSADETTRSFLDRFLSIFQAEWDELDRRVEESDAFLDPKAVPEGVAMNYLASWFGLELEGTWNGIQNRQLLEAVPKIFPQRGTLKALTKYIGVYLANISGLTPEEIEATSFPAIIEGFRERTCLLLSQDGAATLGESKPLWGPGVVRRLQLGGFSREGEVELVSTGDPERDLFHHYAHRFRVYAPAAWVRTAEHEQLLRRAIEAEMPAHVKYDLCLVDAGLCVDMQSTVGLDTIIGDPPAFRLSCEPEKDASSLPTRNQLGLGAVLSGGARRGPAVLRPGARVGGWILN
jgi:phage tail-like protein